MSVADRIRIQHMLDAAQELMAFTKGRTVDDLRTNRMLLLALVKEIEILGEAATQISEDFRLSRPGYTVGDDQRDAQPAHPRVFGRERRSAWSTVASDLPELERELNALLSR